MSQPTTIERTKRQMPELLMSSLLRVATDVHMERRELTLKTVTKGDQNGVVWMDSGQEKQRRGRGGQREEQLPPLVIRKRKGVQVKGGAEISESGHSHSLYNTGLDVGFFIYF